MTDRFVPLSVLEAVRRIGTWDGTEDTEIAEAAEKVRRWAAGEVLYDSMRPEPPPNVTVGTLYADTDEAVVKRWTGTEWETLPGWSVVTAGAEENPQ